jgi:hypothetical protein
MWIPVDRPGVEVTPGGTTVISIAATKGARIRLHLDCGFRDPDRDRLEIELVGVSSTRKPIWYGTVQAPFEVRNRSAVSTRGVSSPRSLQ